MVTPLRRAAALPNVVMAVRRWNRDRSPPWRHALALTVMVLVMLRGAAAEGKPMGPQDPVELETFLDGLLGGLMQERSIPGAVVLVVKDGTVFFAKGYGFADVETERRVDPETTLFRVASVSKLFTATAVMQLVETGKLDLHADVNGYLDGFSLDRRFDKPVTLAHLLTHTGGFDDAFLGAAQPLDRTPVPLGGYLATHMPPRVMPPGEIISYSNHGMALAGHLVERASGQPFAEYVKEHILTPLGMQRSGFGLPFPLPVDLAIPYDYRDGAYVAIGYDRLLIGPAGDLYASAADIARFMIAHLQEGRFDQKMILRPETVREMQRRQFTHHSRLAGLCYGFVEAPVNGIRAVGHAGGWPGWGSLLLLVPDARLGLLVSTNRHHDQHFFNTFIKRFFDRYLPRSEPLLRPEPPADFSTRAARFTGSYVPNQHVRSSFLKLFIYRQEARVTAEPDGTLTFRKPGGASDPISLVEVEPLLFVTEKGDYVSFRVDPKGRVTHLLGDLNAWDKVSWLASPRTHDLVIRLCVLLFFATILGWFIAAVVRRVSPRRPSTVPRNARRLGFLVALLNCSLIAGVAALAEVPLDTLWLQGAPSWLAVLGAITLVSVPLSLGLPYLLLRSLGQPAWTTLGRLHFAALTLAALLFDGWLYYWNLLAVGL